MRYRITLYALLLLCINLSATAETINIGSDRKVEVIDGTIKESTAVDALKYLKNVYERKSSITGQVRTILKYYHGPLEADFKLLNGKSWFLEALLAEQRRSPTELEMAYVNFINLYDGHRNHPIVKNGELLRTLDKAIHILLSEPHFGFSDRMSYSNLKDLLRFGALRLYMTGKPSAELEQYIRASYRKSVSWDSANLKKGVYKLVNGKYLTLAAPQPDGWRNCGYSGSPYPSAEIVGAALFLNMLSHTFEAEAGARCCTSRKSVLPAPPNSTCNGWVLKPSGGYGAGDLFDGHASKLKINGVKIDAARGGTFFNLADFIKKNKGPFSLDILVGDDYRNIPPFTISGTWSGELSHSGNFDNGELWLSDLNVGTITLEFPPLLDHIMAIYGNIYDWVGIAGSGSVGPESSKKSPAIL